MYTTLLFVHSMVRWIILAVFLYALVRAYYGWISNQTFSKLDSKTLILTAAIAHLQILLGLWLYFISPIVSFFLQNFKIAVSQKQFRFFGMEHGIMMIAAVTLITIGAAKAKRKKTDKEKFKTMAIWYSLGIIVALAGIPWS